VFATHSEYQAVLLFKQMPKLGDEPMTFMRPNEGAVMAIIVMGIDLAKNVFAVLGVSEVGSVGLRQPKVRAPS